MRHCADRVRFDLFQKTAELRVVRQVCAQCDCVKKEANQILQLWPSTAGDRRAHHNVIGSGITCQQNVEDRQSRIKQGRGV